jgi:sugar lactone lactonase YvrE
MLVAVAGTLACVTGSAPNDVEIQWPPKGTASPAVVHWIGEFSELESGGFRKFLQTVAGAEGEDQGQRLGRPVALTVHNGTVAVADTWFGAVVLSDFEGGTSRVLDLPDRVQPNSVAFSHDGSSILVGDGPTGAVFTVDLGGDNPRTLLEGGVLGRCGDLVAMVSGGIVMTDPAGGRVVRISADGEITHSTGGTEGPSAGVFNTPTALAEDPDGSLWMVDTFNFRIVHLSAELEILGSFGRHGDASGDFALPKGIAVDPDGHIYVSDARFDAIQVFEPDGRLLLVIGGHGTGRGEFLNPAGLAFTSDGTLLVADSGNRRVQVLEYRSREVAR